MNSRKTIDNGRVGLARTVWRFALRKRAEFERWRVQRCRAQSHRMILNTPPLPIHPQAEIEIHSLTCENDYPDLLWCLKTFQFFAGRDINVVIHDDGSLSPQALRHLQQHLPGATVVSRQQADERIQGIISPYQACQAFRDRLPLARRLFDFPVFATRSHFLILDSDILFFASPQEMLQRIKQKQPFFMSDYQDGYVYPREVIAARYGVDVMPAFNTGISYLAKHMFDYDFIERYCGDLEQAGFQFHPWAEQTLFAMLFSRHSAGADRLPPSYGISRKGLNKQSVSHHFVNDGSRGLFYTQGIWQLVRDGFLARYAQKADQPVSMPERAV